MSSTISKVKPKHRTMMEDMVFDGLTSREVCEKYGMTEGRFSLIRKSPLWMLEEKELRQTYRVDRSKAMESLLPAAINVFKMGVRCPDLKIAISAAKEICDRGGLPRGIILDTETPIGSEVLYETLEDINKEKEAIFEELGIETVEELIEMAPANISEGTND